MPAPRLLLLGFLILLHAGCMLSDQVGQMPQDLTFHFDTDFNRAIVFGRAAGLMAIVFWLFAKFKSHTAILVGVPILVFAGWTVARDYPSLSGYRIEVRRDSLYLSIPPEPAREIPWESIQEIEIEGESWATVEGGRTTTVNPDGTFQETKYAWSELPQWKTMKLITEKDSFLVQLDRLSVEQRQTLLSSIAKRGRLVSD
jgi:hypothetical protein